MVLPLLALVGVFAGQPAFSFHAFGPYERAVPTPESVLGYGPGEHQTTYFQQEKVLQELVKHAPARVRYETYGKTNEGRPLRVLLISSKDNIAKLESIRKDIAALASGKATDADAIIRRSPSVVWVNECIHGNEPASFESGMWLAYNLAASNNPQITKMLESTVVVLNPSYNPDGHERFAVWYNSVATGSPDEDTIEHHEPRQVNGRSNHYRFDMNRDRVAMSQQETRQEVAEFLKWNPQIYVDQHGQVNTYFFPPASLSVNTNVDRARYNKWADILGRSTAAAFDQHGFLYYVKDIFDLYYPGYLDSWTTLSGAIGMTHETDGSYAIRANRGDGSVATLAGSMAKHFTSALAVIGVGAQQRQELLTSYAAFKKKCASGNIGAKGPFIYAEGTRESVLGLKDQLSASGIESRVISNGGELQGAESFWSGKPESVKITGDSTLLEVPMAQPQSALAKALLEPQSDFEPEFVTEQLKRRAAAMSEEKYPQADQAEFYDLTGWSPIFARNMCGWWASGVREGQPNTAAAKNGPSVVGYALLPSVQGDLTALKLMRDGYNLSVTTRPMRTASGQFPPGTVLVFRERNTKDVSALADVGGMVPIGAGYPEEGRQGPGSESVSSLRKGALGVLFGSETAPTQYSSVWYLLEQQLKLPFTPMHNDALEGDLKEYSCIIFPGGRREEPSDKLKDWVRNGGCAILLGGPGWATGEKGFTKFDLVKADKGQPAGLPGSIFRANLDQRSFLAYGYPRGEIAVPVEGNRFYKARPEGGSVITFSSDEKVKKLLSGWEWPDDTEKNLSGSVWLHDLPFGRGHVIFFMQDPTDRAMWPGLNGLLLNAILFGPGT